MIGPGSFSQHQGKITPPTSWSSQPGEAGASTQVSCCCLFAATTVINGNYAFVRGGRREGGERPRTCTAVVYTTHNTPHVSQSPGNPSELRSNRNIFHFLVSI